jgi:hypothetical protein
MALQVADRVQVTATANTTVSFTLGSAVTGFQSFSAITSGNTTYYAATDVTGDWEVGYGTYSSSGPTLNRTTILSSSNSGSAVTFSGTVTVFITYPSERAVYVDSNSTANAPVLAATNGLITNNMTVGTSYTIPSGYSASSTGPITLSSGVSVTVPSGSRWVVL